MNYQTFIPSRQFSKYIKCYSLVNIVGINWSAPDITDSVIKIYPSGDKYIPVEFISTVTSPDGKKC